MPSSAWAHRARAAALGCAARRRSPGACRRRRWWRAPTTPSWTRASTRSRSCWPRPARRRARPRATTRPPPKPAACWTRWRCGGRCGSTSHDRSRDQAFGEQVEAALAATEAWMAREPSGPKPGSTWAPATAPAPSGAACAASSWRRPATASASRRRSSARSRSTRRLQDARFGIGLYQFYADVAPSALKLLRWLLLLPGGDRAAGLQAMEQARTRRAGAAERGRLPAAPRSTSGTRRTPSARSCWPGSCGRAIRTTPISSRWRPTSTTCTARIRRPACRSGAAWPTPRRRIAWRTPELGGGAGATGRGAQLDRLGETDLAIEQLRTLLASPAAAPVGARGARPRGPGARHSTAWARATEAVAPIQAALAAVPAGDPFQSAPRGARRAAPRPRPRRPPQAYRLSLEGWRALERGALAEAARALGRALALRPADPATRYRQARLQLAERHIAEGVERARGGDQRPGHAAARLRRRLLSRGAARSSGRAQCARAIELYRLVVGAFGVDPVLKADGAARARARSQAGVSSVDVERARSGIGAARRLQNRARRCRHLTRGVRLSVVRGRVFDKILDFVLDTRRISPVIYIWYEGGWLSPPIVTAERSSEVESLTSKEKQMAKKAAKGAKKKAAKKR